MALSQAIEYLLTIKTPEGRQIVHQAMSQIHVPLFPAGAQLNIEIPPARGDYANIIAILQGSDEVLPNVFQAVITIQGTNTLSAILTSDGLRHSLDTFGIITQSIPARATITNISGITQFFSFAIGYLVIRTEADFKMVFDKLQHADIVGIFSEFQKVLKK